MYFVFFFQAEDGIRDIGVTGVQTCALPISDGELTLDFILDERGRELYLESIRRTDLIRFDKFTTDSYIWQWKGGVLDGRAVNAKYNIYPIPATDLTANPNLTNSLY